MQQFFALPLYAALYFIALLVLIEFGRRVGERQLRLDPEGARTGVGAFEGAIFGLFGLLLAFTFSGAAERMGARRSLIVEEVNAIGTAWLRIDLLPADRQGEIRQLYREYVDDRIAFYRTHHR